MSTVSQQTTTIAPTSPCSCTKGWGGLISEVGKNVTYAVLGAGGSYIGSTFATAQKLAIGSTSLITGGLYTTANLVAHLGIKTIQSCIPSYKKDDESGCKTFSRLLGDDPLEFVKLVAGTFVSGAVSTALPYYFASEEDFITGNETTAADYTTLPSTTDDSSDLLKTLGSIGLAYTAQFCTLQLINGVYALHNRCTNKKECLKKGVLIEDLVNSFLCLLPDFANSGGAGRLSTGAGIGAQAGVLAGITGVKYGIDVGARWIAKKKVDKAIAEKSVLSLSVENQEKLATLKEQLLKSKLTKDDIEEIGTKVDDIVADADPCAVTIPVNQEEDGVIPPQPASPDQGSRASTPDPKGDSPLPFEKSGAFTPIPSVSSTESLSAATSPPIKKSPNTITASISVLATSSTLVTEGTHPLTMYKLFLREFYGLNKELSTGF